MLNPGPELKSRIRSSTDGTTQAPSVRGESWESRTCPQTLSASYHLLSLGRLLRGAVFSPVNVDSDIVCNSVLSESCPED